MNITLNVGGKIFETKYDNIIKIPYFCNMFKICDEQLNTTLFIDRPGHIFKHVLAFIIDPLYPFPIKYAFELDFYDISYDITKLYDKNKNILQKLEYIMMQNNKCKNNKCKNLAELYSITCKDHRKCSIINCDKYTRKYNYCEEHLDKGIYCCKYGCTNKKKIGRFMCDEHLKPKQ